MKLYVNCITSGAGLRRDIKELIPEMNLRRRMSRVVKSGVAAGIESLLEFGMRSRTGRTLEKSGCAAIAFDQILLKRVAQTVAERCHNEIGLHENSIMETDWLRLIMAFLDQLRTKGAFFDVT
mgnify:FL=1